MPLFIFCTILLPCYKQEYINSNSTVKNGRTSLLFSGKMRCLDLCGQNYLFDSRTRDGVKLWIFPRKPNLVHLLSRMSIKKKKFRVKSWPLQNYVWVYYGKLNLRHSLYFLAFKISISVIWKGYARWLGRGGATYLFSNPFITFCGLFCSFFLSFYFFLGTFSWLKQVCSFKKRIAD